MHHDMPLQELTIYPTVQFFAAGTAAAGTAKDMGVLIAMRMLQAAGTSSLLSLGAASIAASDCLLLSLGIIVESRVFRMYTNRINEELSLGYTMQWYESLAYLSLDTKPDAL